MKYKVHTRMMVSKMSLQGFEIGEDVVMMVKHPTKYRRVSETQTAPSVGDIGRIIDIRQSNGISDGTVLIVMFQGKGIGEWEKVPEDVEHVCTSSKPWDTMEWGAAPSNTLAAWWSEY